MKSKIKKYFSTLKKRIKHLIRVLPYSILLSIVLPLCRYEIFVSLIIFMGGNILVDYASARDIKIRKRKYASIYEKNFNDDYFELYYETNLSWLLLLFNSQVFIITFLNYIFDIFKTGIMYGAIWSGVFSLIGVGFWAVFLTYGKKESLLQQLMNIRGEKWSGDYTLEEQEILKALEDTISN